LKKYVPNIVIKKRIIFLFILFTVLVLVMILRLAYVQFFLSEEINDKATDSWLRDIVFQPERGEILDRHNKFLTKNITSPSVVVVPRQIKDVETTTQHLARILDLTEKEAHEYVTKNQSSVAIHPKGRKNYTAFNRAIRLKQHITI